jgi:hypothetical protein
MLTDELRVQPDMHYLKTCSSIGTVFHLEGVAIHPATLGCI